MFSVEVTAPEQEGAFSAEVIFTTQFEVFTIVFTFTFTVMTNDNMGLLMHVCCVTESEVVLVVLVCRSGCYAV